MKRLLFALLFALITIAAPAQSKQEIKAIKKEEKAKQKQAYEEELAKNGATILRVTTNFETQQEALDYIVAALVTRGTTPISINNDYYIVKTDRKMVGSNSYESTYTIIKKDNKVLVQAQSIGRQGLVIGAAINSVPDFLIKYGYKSEIHRVVWKEMQEILFATPHESPQYIKE